MNDAEATVVPRDRAPLADAPARDVAQDVLAVMALLVALPMPWDATHRGTDRLEIVLVTVLAILAVAAPYALRGGLLPTTWERVATPRARVLGCAPYVVVVGLYLALDLTRSEAEAGLVGGGLALGLAGAVLGAAPRWPFGLAVATGVVAALALAAPVLAVLDGEGGAAILGSVLNLLLVAGVLWLTAVALLRGDLVGGIVLVAVGAAIALELALLGGGSQRPWFESTHGERIGLLLLPVVAAFAVPRVLDGLRAAAAGPPSEHAARWVSVAVRVLDLVLLVAAFVAIVAILRTVTDGVSVNHVLRIIFGALMALVAVLARRALVRDARGGHVTAVGGACVLVVLGLVIVVARAGVGTRSNLEELLVTFALPAMVLLALLVPPSVRALVATDGPAHAATDGPAHAATHAATDGPAHAGPADRRAAPAWSAQEHEPRPTGVTEPAQDPAEPAGSWQAHGARAGASTGGGERVRADQTQALPPVEGPADRTQTLPLVRETHGGAPHGAEPARRPHEQVQPGHDLDATQTLPAAVDVPGSRWTAAQALDPSTPLADLALIVQEAPHLRPHVAANPSTYPALLDWLGALGDPAVDAALRSRR